MNSFSELKMIVFSSMFSALIAAGSYIVIPIGHVPIVLQNLFVLLAGLTLGKKWGVISVVVYIFSGICGLPVFAGGKSGISHVLGFTGGYLIGYIPAVYLIGLISEKMKYRITFDIAAMILGTIIIYFFGILWLIHVTKFSLSKALILGMYPFLIGDALKIAAAISIVKSIRPLINESYNRN